MECVKEIREQLVKMMAETMKEIGLAQAIREGRQNEFVSKEHIIAILDEPA